MNDLGVTTKSTPMQSNPYPPREWTALIDRVCRLCGVRGGRYLAAVVTGLPPYCAVLDVVTGAHVVHTAGHAPSDVDIPAEMTDGPHSSAQRWMGTEDCSHVIVQYHAIGPAFAALRGPATWPRGGI